MGDRVDERAIIRKYRPEDREAVREISWNTADQGRTVDLYFHDHEAVADLLTQSYTDCEPEALWVAECDGAVVGYLTGCLNTPHCNRRIVWRIGPRAVARAIGRGALWRGETWRLLAALVRTVLLGGIPKVDFDKYPAHLHINLRQGFRGRGLGRRLIEHFRGQVRELGLPGIHLVAWGDNQGGRRFFEAMGFRLLREQPLVLPEERGYKKTSTVVYGWTTEDRDDAKENSR
jgi:ribosomal protein S18 acetylase RimI-like enzyme